MVQRSVLDACFAALADPTRRTILEALQTGEQAVSQLAAPLPMSLPAAQKHVRVLEEAGLVQTRKQGRRRLVRLQAAPLQETMAWMRRYRPFWEERLDSLGDLLGTVDGDASAAPTTQETQT